VVQFKAGGPGIALSVQTAAARILLEGDERISAHAASKLMRLLGLLRGGQMETLGSAQKAELFEAFLDLWIHKNQGTIARVCGLVFGGTSHGTHPAALPEKMIDALIQTGRSERSRKIKGKIWDVLIRTVPELHKRILPSDLLFGLWLDHPVYRRNIIRYLFAHFTEAVIVDAMKKPTGDEAERRLAASFASLSNATRLLKERPWILAEMFHCTVLDPDESARLRSFLVATLNRFDLLRLLPHLQEKPMDTGEASVRSGQLCLPFRSPPGTRSLDPEFEARVKAIKR
jgi:hypothetical protein